RTPPGSPQDFHRATRRQSVRGLAPAAGTVLRISPAHGASSHALSSGLLTAIVGFRSGVSHSSSVPGSAAASLSAARALSPDGVASVSQANRNPKSYRRQ